MKLKLTEGDWKQDGLDYLWKTRKIYLVYADEKNKMRKKLINTEDYENYFDNHKLEDKNNG